ncbi:MAG: inorganic diphosphatase [Desulfuromonadales bacterium]|nr:inorganic diphosphatase [Desulfuromonadales bacterium]NIR33675.1 inorganic diphosphatase [Desulfuromonadales bacterium]NIS41286.1 inorganic diphosphatase [Desulfuromonadales bacterium]
MHPWHDIDITAETVAEGFPSVIEIPAGSKNKYELDKVTGMLRLDRVLYGAVHYPVNYGFIPRTFCDDGDPLDVLVLGQEPVEPMTLVQARAIGVMRMRDEGKADDKIIAVNLHDPAVSEFGDQRDLPPHLMAEMRKFFEEYKTLEHKEVAIDKFQGPVEAVQIITEALELYRRDIAPRRS